mgnify:CR=1 FL=1
MRINCLVEDIKKQNNEIRLIDNSYHYLSKVLRIKIGQNLIIFDGLGLFYKVSVREIKKNEILTSIQSQHYQEIPDQTINLFQAIPKNSRWEIILQKAVELGITNIYPMITENVESKFNEKKFLRWKEIIKSSAEQSECRWIPNLHLPEKFSSTLEKIKEHDVCLIGSLYSNSKKLKEIPWKSIRKISLFIGPEGDFSENEINHAIDKGVIPVTFGPQVLRTETAAIFGLSVIAHELR